MKLLGRADVRPNRGAHDSDSDTVSDEMDYAVGKFNFPSGRGRESGENGQNAPRKKVGPRVHKAGRWMSVLLVDSFEPRKRSSLACSQATEPARVRNFGRNDRRFAGSKQLLDDSRSASEIDIGVEQQKGVGTNIIPGNPQGIPCPEKFGLSYVDGVEAEVFSSTDPVPDSAAEMANNENSSTDPTSHELVKVMLE